MTEPLETLVVHIPRGSTWTYEYCQEMHTWVHERGGTFGGIRELPKRGSGPYLLVELPRRYHVMFKLIWGGV